jgi:predicted short-subunit dehydrogenase-like oxidoreductase (DUF2520 family)
MKIAIIGTGRLGGALAIALSRAGLDVVRLVSRDMLKAREIAAAIQRPAIAELRDPVDLHADTIIIATQDDRIESTAARLRSELTSAPVVLHTSGSMSSSALESLREAGCFVGSMHPLVSISDPLLGSSRFRDAYFCIEGDAEAVGRAIEIIAALRGLSFTIAPQNKALYHAAAVTAAGHVTALFSVALEMMAASGVESIHAQAILLPLLQSTVANLQSQTPAAALTGTFARGDRETLLRHLTAFASSSLPWAAVSIYLGLALRSIDLVSGRMQDDEAFDEMRRDILIAKRNCRC